MNQFNFIEVCAGAGGLSSGLIKAGLQPSLLIDNDKHCYNTLLKNHSKQTKIICDNFENINFAEWKNIDVLCGGVPCQSFSYAGKRKGVEDPRGSLIFSFFKLVEDVSPKIFLIENVKGLMTHNSGNTLKKLIDNVSGYNIKIKLLNSNDFDVPQNRHRLFIVGVRSDLNTSFIFPEPQKNKLLLKDVLYNVPESNGFTYPLHKQKLFKKIPQGGCWKNLSEQEQKEYLGNSFNSGGGKTGILHRLSMEKPSLTLLCSPMQKQTDRCHPLFERPLTLKEYSRIQTFDDDYVFTGSTNSIYKQIGNAVPVNLGFYIGKQLINCLNNLL